MFSDEMVTGSLIRYIQAIQRERRTGMLIVKRGDTNAQEEGRVRFTNGHVTETKLGRRAGAEAFNDLCTWSHCYVSFISSDGKEFKAPIPATPPTPPPMERTNLYAPGESPLRRRASTPSGSLNVGGGNSGEQEQQKPVASVLKAKPARTCPFNTALQIIDTIHLSRAHRQILLLIDGQRTVEELIHVSTRPQDDVLQLLRDLAQASVIRI